LEWAFFFFPFHAWPLYEYKYFFIISTAPLIPILVAFPSHLPKIGRKKLQDSIFFFFFFLLVLPQFPILLKFFHASEYLFVEIFIFLSFMAYFSSSSLVVSEITKDSHSFFHLIGSLLIIFPWINTKTQSMSADFMISFAALFSAMFLFLLYYLLPVVPKLRLRWMKSKSSVEN
jgi:hypothetical protein